MPSHQHTTQRNLINDSGVKGIIKLLTHHQEKHNRFLAIEVNHNKFISPKGYAKYREACMELQLKLT